MAFLKLQDPPEVTALLARRRCPLETEFGVTPGVVTYCGSPAAPGHTWCREHVWEYGVGEDQ